jgi:AhpD family alkylhydroperoxidase
MTLPALDLETAPPAARELLHIIETSWGPVPMLNRVMANSPALLHGYVDLSRALNEGLLPADVRERIAITIAAQNACAHCLAGHTYLARNVVKLPTDEIAAARRGDSRDPRIRAILGFAAAVNNERGAVGDELFAAARAVGVTDAELAETVGHVTVNVLTNYLAKTARIDPE